MPDLPNPPPGPDNTPRKPSGPTFWDSFRRVGWLYIPIIIFILWMWRDMFSSMLTKTIDYSVFKEHLVRGEVDECKISDTEILGHITPKEPAKENHCQGIRKGRKGQRAGKKGTAQAGNHSAG